MDLQGRQGQGAFQWNQGGWFGAQLGMTLWIVILGAVLLAGSQPVGGWLIALSVLANGVGWWLWTRRETLAPYPAIQALIATGGLCAVLSIICLASSGVARETSGMPTAWFLLMYPGLMLIFHLQERAARNAAAE